MQTRHRSGEACLLQRSRIYRRASGDRR